MRGRFSALLFIIFLSYSSFAQIQSVTIRIVQGDAVYTPGLDKTAIRLEKKSFKIQVLLQNTEGVYAFASFKDSLFDLPGNAPVPGFSDLPSMAMAEEEFNKEKELIVGDDGWSYWFFDPALSWHRFNKKIIHLDSGRVVGAKTIKQFYIQPDGNTVKLKDNSAPLYLFFTAMEKKNPEGKPPGEVFRSRIKIEWIDEE